MVGQARVVEAGLETEINQGARAGGHGGAGRAGGQARVGRAGGQGGAGRAGGQGGAGRAGGQGGAGGMRTFIEASQARSLGGANRVRGFNGIKMATSIIKFADDTVVLGLISYNDETAYLDEVERLTSWCQNNCLSLNVSKIKELIVDFRKRQQLPYTPLIISGTPVERVSSFNYLSVNISEDLTWTTHIQTQVKIARQRLYHLRQLRKFRVSPAILKTFYSGAIECVLMCISVWYGNVKSCHLCLYSFFSNTDCVKALNSIKLEDRVSLMYNNRLNTQFSVKDISLLNSEMSLSSLF